MNIDEINPRQWNELAKLDVETADDPRQAPIPWSQVVQMQTSHRDIHPFVSQSKSKALNRTWDRAAIRDRPVTFLVTTELDCNGYYALQAALKKLMKVDPDYLADDSFCNQISFRNLMPAGTPVTLKDGVELSCQFIVTMPMSFKRSLRVQAGDISFLWELAAALEEQPGIARVEPDLPYLNQALLHTWIPGCTVPRDEAPVARDWALKMVRYDKVPSPKLTGRGIVIGQIDSGYTDHPELDVSQTIDRGRQWDSVDDNRSAIDTGSRRKGSHGTATASLLTSQHHTQATDDLGDFGEGITGIAPEATLIPVRAFDIVITAWWSSNIVQALEHLLTVGCDVITMSFGGFLPPAAEALLAEAWRRNIILCAAAGNCVPWVVEPASYSSVIACGGVGLTPGTADLPRVWTGSSRGPEVDISAPAENVYVANWRNNNPIVLPSQGTSFAAPHVAGAAALWLEKHSKQTLLARYRGRPERLGDVFKTVLKNSAWKPRGWDAANHGAGILDVNALLQAPLP